MILINEYKKVIKFFELLNGSSQIYRSFIKIYIHIYFEIVFD